MSVEERISALEQRLDSQTVFYPRRVKTAPSVYTKGATGPTLLKVKPTLLTDGTYSTLTTWKDVSVASYVPSTATSAVCSLKTFLQADIVMQVRGNSEYDATPVAYGSLQGGTVESYAASQFIVELVNGAFQFYIDAAAFSGTLYTLQLVGYFE